MKNKKGKIKKALLWMVGIFFTLFFFMVSGRGVNPPSPIAGDGGKAWLEYQIKEAKEKKAKNDIPYGNVVDLLNTYNRIF